MTSRFSPDDPLFDSKWQTSRQPVVDEEDLAVGGVVAAEEAEGGGGGDGGEDEGKLRTKR